jgi:2-polyprenyl-3-methyl-5-hydroxy-6-metoxy-1,4-benzoquinol methylase
MLKQSLITLDAQQNDFRRNALIKVLLPLIQGDHVLDIGCGMGFMTQALAAQGRKVVALDTEYEFVASALAKGRSYEAATQGVTYTGDRLPFSDKAFDTAVCLDVLEHIEDDQNFLKEIRRVLQPHSRIIITTPALSALYGQRDVELGHYRRYDKAKVATLLAAAGLAVEKLSYWNLLGVPLYFISEKILRRPINDTIRQGKPTLIRHIMAQTLSRWLVYEGNFRLPLGLSIIAVATKL